MPPANFTLGNAENDKEFSRVTKEKGKKAVKSYWPCLKSQKQIKFSKHSY